MDYPAQYGQRSLQLAELFCRTAILHAINTCKTLPLTLIMHEVIEIQYDNALLLLLLARRRIR